MWRLMQPTAVRVRREMEQTGAAPPEMVVT
jgi:hypothetical protein